MSHFSLENTPTQIHRDAYSLSYSSNSNCNSGTNGLEANGLPGNRSSTASGGTSSGNSLPVSASQNATSSSAVDLINENAQLISRTTQQTKTQQTKTITKTIVSRETRFIGPDGQALDYNPYGTLGPMPPAPPSSVGQGYAAYTGSDMDNYSQGFNDANPTYGTQPNNYPPHMEYHNYQDYPLNTSTPPSVTSDSPPPIRRMSTTMSAAHGQPINHIPQSGYDELDASLQYAQFAAEHNPYGYAPGPIQLQHQHQAAVAQSMHSPGGGGGGGGGNGGPAYNPYEQQPPQGYLDRRPSYDEHGLYGPSPASLHTPMPHAIFDQAGGQLQLAGANGGPGGDVRWRDPDLHEVIEFLGHPNSVIKANAAAYLQHLCFMDDAKKQKTRALGGIPPLINLLNQDVPEVLKNACGALRNLSYGRKNDENKRAIRNAGGIPGLVKLLRKAADSQDIKELVTGILWNLSSCEDLKRPILDDAVAVLVNQILIPASGWDGSGTGTGTGPGSAGEGSILHAGMNGANVSSSHRIGEPMYWSNVFKNASGVLRNISSAGEYARRKLRECDGLVDALLFLTRTAITKNDMDNKSIENCVCVLRNLSYRCQEVVDPNYDSQPPPSSANGTPNQNSSLSPSSSRAAAIMGSVGSKVGDNLGCFGGSKKKDKSKGQTTPTASPSADHLTQATQNLNLKGNGVQHHGLSGTPSTLPRNRPGEPVRGCDLLWQPEIVQPYLALLSGCSNPETLEAAAGAIQNLSACYWQPSIDIRAAVRKEKGLPVLVELLRMEVDRVVCAVATALRNLAMDSRNKELIGKYAMKDLVSKLPKNTLGEFCL